MTRLTTEELFSRAEAIGVQIPHPPTPKGDYRPAVLHGSLIYTSGMGTMLNGVRHHVGYVGKDISLAEAQEAGVIAALNALSVAIEAAGGVENLDSLVRITGYVRSAPGFIEQSLVLDKASQVLVELLGEAGIHARSAVGVAELPFGISVEIELIAARLIDE